MRLEIHVKPFGSALAGRLGGRHDELPPYAAPAIVGVDRRIENEAVGGSVPGHMDEADKARALKGADMAQAALQDFRVAATRSSPAGPHQRVEGRGLGPRIDAQFNAGWREIQSWLRMVAAPVAWMPLPPSGSKLSDFTTPSSTSMEKRLTRLPRPGMAISSPSARA